jgi:hypothetical protein
MQKTEKRGTCIELLLVEEYVEANSPHPHQSTKTAWKSRPTGLNMLFKFLNETKKSTLRFPQRVTMIHYHASLVFLTENGSAEKGY